MPDFRLDTVQYVNPPAPLDAQINALSRFGITPRYFNYARGMLSVYDLATYAIFPTPYPPMYIAWFTSANPADDPIAINVLTSTDGSEAGMVGVPPNATHWAMFYSGPASLAATVWGSVFFGGVS